MGGGWRRVMGRMCRCRPLLLHMESGWRGRPECMQASVHIRFAAMHGMRPRSPAHCCHAQSHASHAVVKSGMLMLCAAAIGAGCSMQVWWCPWKGWNAAGMHAGENACVVSDAASAHSPLRSLMNLPTIQLHAPKHTIHVRMSQTCVISDVSQPLTRRLAGDGSPCTCRAYVFAC